jgi:hypothetical protein
MKYGDLKSRFPRASPSFLELNADSATDFLVDDTGPLAVVEQHPGDGTVAALPVQKPTGKRFLVRVQAIRTRLIDEDNLCEKYHVDLLRYASGKLFGDSPATTRIEVCQQKAGKGEPEEVRIDVYEIG